MVSSNWEQQVDKLEQLVEAGNREAVMAAANRFNDASTDNTDVDCERSRQSLTDNSTTSADVTPKPLSLSAGRDT